MEKEQTLFKGEMMEELLRNYFLSVGYFVVRGVKYRYEGNDVTDVDLFLYGRSSSLIRERINVDIKNKKTPQAFERILWANGLMKLLKFDSCVVATTERKPAIHSFGQLQNTIILDGAFLTKLKAGTFAPRLAEEDLLNELAKHKSHKTFGNKDWRYIYEISKSRLLNELDFAGFNATLKHLQYFIEKYLTDTQKKEVALRMIYLTISHLLITIDYILKDIAFLEPREREQKLLEGFTFGNLGKDGVNRIIDMAVKISGSKSAKSIMNILEDIPNNILKEFFSKSDTSKNLFFWAKEFEQLAFRKAIAYPNEIEPSLKGVVSIMLDYFKIERKRFFNIPSSTRSYIGSKQSIFLSKDDPRSPLFNLSPNNLITLSDVQCENCGFNVKISSSTGKVMSQTFMTSGIIPISIAVDDPEYTQVSFEIKPLNAFAPLCKLNFSLSKVTEFPKESLFFGKLL